MIRSTAAVFFYAAMLLAAACRPAPVAERVAATTPWPRDVHSFAQPDVARVTDVALDLSADFTARRLAGTATLTLERAPDAERVILDTRDLDIAKVTDAAGTPLVYDVGQPDLVLGQALNVRLQPDTRVVVVTYATRPEAAALQWLTPEQTAGRRLPYLYSQGQAILTRTWIPTQDSPGIRQTYSARIVVPNGLRAVMSAEQRTPEGVPNGAGTAFEFRMNHAIPPYLIALAVGDVQSRAVGTRTAVYAEPAVVDGAAAEFQDLEQMVGVAEQLLGPYRWGRYDLLVLPPSFPFGGMENPRLTFATPTVLAGDRSLVSLAAHELAHSWSGNLVTNATWSDFWLNEGITSYIEIRIMEALYGVERAQMLEVLERQDLTAAFEDLGSRTHPDSMLHMKLEGRDPDEGATQIPYAKGSALLRVIEHTVGRTRFDAYLRSYFDRFAFQSITTAAFAADVKTHLLGEDGARQMKLDEWLYQPGLPDNATIPRSAAFEAVDRQVKAFIDGASLASLTAQKWSTQEWQHFLGALPGGLPVARLGELDRAFRLTASGNSEVLFAWLRVAIRHAYEPAWPAVERFLTTQGRRKFLRPLYEDLLGSSWASRTQPLYQRARPLYHSVATSSLDPLFE
ncbi:MAG: M1 family metallopeptidase [Vicinamibacterales bacterium]